MVVIDDDGTESYVPEESTPYGEPLHQSARHSAAGFIPGVLDPSLRPDSDSDDDDDSFEASSSTAAEMARKRAYGRDRD